MTSHFAQLFNRLKNWNYFSPGLGRLGKRYISKTNSIRAVVLDASGVTVYDQRETPSVDVLDQQVIAHFPAVADMLSFLGQDQTDHEGFWQELVQVEKDLDQALLADFDPATLGQLTVSEKASPTWF